MFPEGTSREGLNHRPLGCGQAQSLKPVICAYTRPAIPHSLYNSSPMENQQIADVIKKFDNFVHFSLTHKEVPASDAPLPGTRVDNYLREMEKRLKLRPKSHEQKFQKLLRPMKSLKSFVSVKQFMESLGECAMGRPCSGERNQQALKLGYQNARGGYYMERIQQHLRNKQFKRSSKNPQFYVTELEEHSLETSEYRSWIENALGKINTKNDQFFKKTEGRLGEEQPTRPPEKDCLMEEHQKEYADQFKVVPHMRELCTQEYENFAKISSLLTGRLRKILKNNGTAKKQLGGRMQGIDPQDNQEKLRLRRTTRAKENKDAPLAATIAGTARKTNKKRVQTAGVRRDETDEWRDMVTSKLKNIINQSAPPPLIPLVAQPSIMQD